MFDGPEQETKESYIARQGGMMMRSRTKLERLRDMKQGLEAKLEEVNQAIKLLEDNPQLTEVINALERVNV